MITFDLAVAHNPNDNNCFQHTGFRVKIHFFRFRAVLEIIKRLTVYFALSNNLKAKEVFLACS